MSNFTGYTQIHALEVMHVRAVAALVITVAFLTGGCRDAAFTDRPTTRQIAVTDGLSEPQYLRAIEAECLPPQGWTAQPLKQSPRHTHQIWLSPSQHTAYGVIHFSLPLPVGTELVLLGFMNEMRRTEGEATLIEKNWDPNLKGLRFVAEGGVHRVRTNLFVRGFDGWAIYAGTLRNDAVVPEELALAERARDHTEVGLNKPQ